MGSVEHYSISILKKWYTFLIILLPATTVYASPIPSISLGEILIVAFCVLLLFDMASKRQLIIKTTPMMGYLGYALMATIISGIILGIMSNSYSSLDSVQRVVRDALYFAMALFFAPVYFDFEYGKKIIRKVIFVLGIFAFIQFIVYALSHVYIPGIVPQMKTTISGGFTGAELTEKFALNAAQDGFARPNGFFAEPAVIAQFVSVGLLLELFPQEGKVNFKRALFCSAVMLISFSVNAYVGLFVCWALWALYSNRGNRNALLRIIFFIILAIITFFVMMQNAYTASIINRLVELKNGERTGGSSVMRVIRGMAFYFKMPLFYQIFGSGFGNFIQFKNIYNITTVYEQADEYLNTNAYILISSGIIGFVLYISALFRESRKRHILAGMIAIIIFVFGLSSSIYSSAPYIVMLVFFITAPKKGYEKYEG